MNKKIQAAFLASLALVLIMSPWWISLLSDAVGTDNKAADMICHARPGYTPWVSHIGLSLPGNAEPFLFAIQIVIGLAIFGYCMRLLKKNSKNNLNDDSFR